MLTIREYAVAKRLSYETVRNQIARYRDTDLKGHILKDGRTQLLDDYAVNFLDNHRAKNTIVIVDDTVQTLEELEAKLKETELVNQRLLDNISKLKDGLIEAQKKLITSQEIINDLNNRLMTAETQKPRRSLFSKIFG